MKSLVYPFVLNMWIMGFADESFVNGQVRLSRLTQDEANMIMATPRNN